MFYDIALYVALTVFGVGLAKKVAGWFRFSIDAETRNTPTPASPRFRTALKSLPAVIFSPKLVTLVRVFILDVLFQMRILKEDGLRWAMHMLIFAGFLFLLFTHALDRIIVTSLYDNYSLKLNPFLLVSGLMVISGIAISLYRRFVLRVPRLKTGVPDFYAVAILAIIVISGIALELTKLVSFDHYQDIWYVHIGSCLFGLAFLPFGKLFHVFTTPASLLSNAVMDKNSAPANIKTRQMMELDACTRCGTCGNRCSVAAAYDSIGNEMILPSERMAFLKDFFVDRQIDAEGLAAIQQGVYLCTNCDRCTVACPAGINLRDLWFDVREEMIQRGHAIALVLTPFSYYRGLKFRNFDPGRYDKPVAKARKEVTGRYRLLHESDAVISLTSANREFKNSAGLSDRAGTYSHCFSCENCTTVCPVVGNYEDPQENLDLLPHQIMRSLGFGIKDLAMGSRMLWYCLTCYQCQEHCPQGVKVTDILYEIKNLSADVAVRSPD